MPEACWNLTAQTCRNPTQCIRVISSACGFGTRSLPSLLRVLLWLRVGNCRLFALRSCNCATVIGPVMLVEQTSQAWCVGAISNQLPRPSGDVPATHVDPREDPSSCTGSRSAGGGILGRSDKNQPVQSSLRHFNPSLNPIIHQDSRRWRCLDVLGSSGTLL